MSVNYEVAGFVRRGLLGTILLAFPRDYVVSGIMISALTLISAVIPIAIICYMIWLKSTRAVFVYMTSVVALSPQLFQAWASELVFPDMFVVGILAWAVISTVSGRPRLGVCLLLLGLLAHETTIVFGIPLLLAINWAAYRSGEMTMRSAIHVCGILIAGVVVIDAIQYIFSSPPALVSQSMLRSTQNAPFLSDPVVQLAREKAVFFQSGGVRGVVAAMCINFKWTPQYWINTIVGLVMVLVYCIMLHLRRGLIGVALAVVAPFVFMTLVGTDQGRWLSLSVANAWLLAAARQIRYPAAEAMRMGEIGLGGALLLGLLAMGPTSFNHPSKLAHALALRAGFPDGRALDEDSLDGCDPSWKEVVFGRSPSGGLRKP